MYCRKYTSSEVCGSFAVPSRVFQLTWYITQETKSSRWNLAPPLAGEANITISNVLENAVNEVCGGASWPTTEKGSRFQKALGRSDSKSPRSHVQMGSIPWQAIELAMNCHYPSLVPCLSQGSTVGKAMRAVKAHVKEPKLGPWLFGNSSLQVLVRGEIWLHQSSWLTSSQGRSIHIWLYCHCMPRRTLIISFSPLWKPTMLNGPCLRTPNVKNYMAWHAALAASLARMIPGIGGELWRKVLSFGYSR